jgi:two-component system chemotaxis response regulator CheY
MNSLSGNGLAPGPAEASSGRGVRAAVAKAGRRDNADMQEACTMKILVVDDSRAMRRIVSRTIRQAGFEGHEIVEAENGREALEVVKAQKPDLILSDWHMPEMTGIEFLTALNTEGFVTSESTKEMVDLATEGGAMFLLAKPFTTEDMAQVLGAFVQ